MREFEEIRSRRWGLWSMVYGLWLYGYMVDEESISFSGVYRWSTLSKIPKRVCIVVHEALSACRKRIFAQNTSDR